MLKQNGEFDLNTKFTYDKEWSDEIYQQLLDNQNAIREYAEKHNLQKEYLDSVNVFKQRAEQYDPFADQEDEEMKTNRYFYTYNLMYEYTPSRNLWGQEKPFIFNEELEKISKTFGISRAMANKVVTTPYFVPVSPENISSALTQLACKIEFEWNNDNPLVLVSKIIPCVTAIQPLLDGNHRASHAMIHYYLGKAGLPSITRKKHLKEHYLGYSIFEKNAIINDDINDLIAYYYYNILERQEQICQTLGVDHKTILKSQIYCVPDEEIGGANTL